jgi:hypothetical protein
MDTQCQSQSTLKCQFGRVANRPYGEIHSQQHLPALIAVNNHFDVPSRASFQVGPPSIVEREPEADVRAPRKVDPPQLCFLSRMHHLLP